MPSNVDWDPNLLEESSVKYLFLYHHKGEDLVTTIENLDESNYEIEMYHSAGISVPFMHVSGCWSWNNPLSNSCHFTYHIVYSLMVICT